MKSIISVLALVLSMGRAAAQEWKQPLHATVPDFVVENKQGQKINAQSLRGKLVLINFFATWCPPCRQELPRLQEEIWQKWGGRADFTVMVLAREEGWDKLDPFIRDKGYTFPIYPDLNRGVFSLFADSQIPRNVLVDKEGKIIYQSIGYEPEEFSSLVSLIASKLEKE